MSISDKFEKLLTKAETGESLTCEDIVNLLKLPGDYSPTLFAAADRVRKENVGDEIFLLGIIEFSNYCECNCLYCGLRESNENLSRYRMTDDEIINTAQEIKKSRVSTIVLQSGEDSFYSADRICRLIEQIKNETGLIITLSIGERSAADFQLFLKSGVNTYLLKQETVSPELYKYMRPGCQLDKRMQCLRSLQLLGFKTGTGNIVGMPGQTLEILADDLLFMKQFDSGMLGIGPFIAHPDTPFAGIENDDIELTLRVLAIARLITRDTNIPATTALGTLHPQGRLMALQAGANVVMPDFTPEIYKSRYEIYPGRIDVGPAVDIIIRLEKDFQSIGRTLLYSPGHRPGK